MTMKVRSETLVHWTPSHKDKPPTTEEYIDLLISIYSHGLRYSLPGQDVVHGHECKSEVPHVPMICYTEMRLSHVKQHTERYGKLGIGFPRKKMMREYGANPVFYMTNNGFGVVSTNLNSIVAEQEHIESLRLFLSYVKPMSDYSPNDLDAPLTYYDEMEWRMVLWERLVSGDKTHKRKHWCTRRKDGRYYFSFPHEMVSIIIAPDENVRQAILANKYMRRCFRRHMPMMVTADVSSEF